VPGPAPLAALFISGPALRLPQRGWQQQPWRPAWCALRLRARAPQRLAARLVLGGPDAASGHRWRYDARRQGNPSIDRRRRLRVRCRNGPGV